MGILADFGTMFLDTVRDTIPIMIILVAFQFEDDPHALTIRLVPDVSDTSDTLVFYQIGGSLNHASLVDQVWNLCDHNPLETFA